MNIITQARLLREIYNKASFLGVEETLLTLPTKLFNEWEPNNKYIAGQVLLYNNIKYLCLFDVISQIEIPPDKTSMETPSPYKPYRDSKNYPWVCREYCLQGYKREYDEIWYEVIVDNAGENILTPDIAPNIWKKIKIEQE